MDRSAVNKSGYSKSSDEKDAGQKSKNSSFEKRKSNEDEKSDVKKKQKISFAFSKPLSSATKTTLTTVSKSETSSKTKHSNPKDVLKPSAAFAKAFNNDDDDEEVEMPPEARMRMRNVGRETPTSCGPNSFGKTKRGFCDARSGSSSSTSTFPTKLPNAP